MVSLGFKSPQSIDSVEHRVFSAGFLLQRVIIALVKHWGELLEFWAR